MVSKRLCLGVRFLSTLTLLGLLEWQVRFFPVANVGFLGRHSVIDGVLYHRPSGVIPQGAHSFQSNSTILQSDDSSLAWCHHCGPRGSRHSLSFEHGAR